MKCVSRISVFCYRWKSDSSHSDLFVFGNIVHPFYPNLPCLNEHIEVGFETAAEQHVDSWVSFRLRRRGWKFRVEL